MGRSVYITRLCDHCHDPFETKAGNAKYCKKPECQQAKMRSWRHLSDQRNRIIRTGARIQPHRTGRTCQFVIMENTELEHICGASTRGNWFLCPEHFAQADDYMIEAS